MNRLTPVLLILACACACAPARADDADAALNTTYKSLLGRLDQGNGSRLRDAQRAWIAFRDKECAFKAQGHDDAALARTSRDACVEELTQQRTDQLKRELECGAEDASCVPQAARASEASNGTVATCKAEVGATRAEQYVADCQQVSPATHPPCNVANPCELMVDEIRHSCAMYEKNAPPPCEKYR